jgi:hypothetical protein
MQDRNPPLDTTFFEKVRALDTAIDPALRRYADGLPGGSPFDPKGRDGRMEEFFRDLFHDFLAEGESDPLVARAYTALVSLYRRVIGETTDWLLDDNRRGAPVGRLIAAAVEASSATTIVTFNHDLVVENEIYKRARLREHWCIDHAYGTFSEGREFTGAPSAPEFPHHADGCDFGDRLKVLKLHGSLNWYVRMNGTQPSPRVLTGQAGDRTVLVSRRRSIPHQLVFNRKHEGGRGRTRWYTWPVIIPPIYAKQPLIQAFVPSVWADARNELLRADRLVFFGYSMPQNDIDAEKLFTRAIADNKHVQAVEVVDPLPASAARYAGLVRDRPVVWYPDIWSFLETKPFERGSVSKLSTVGSPADRD